MNVPSHIAFVGDLGLARVNTNPDADLMAVGPWVVLESSLSPSGRLDGIPGPGKA